MCVLSGLCRQPFPDWWIACFLDLNLPSLTKQKSLRKDGRKEHVKNKIILCALPTASADVEHRLCDIYYRNIQKKKKKLLLLLIWQCLWRECAFWTVLFQHQQHWLVLFTSDEAIYRNVFSFDFLKLINMLLLCSVNRQRFWDALSRARIIEGDKNMQIAIIKYDTENADKRMFIDCSEATFKAVSVMDLFIFKGLCTNALCCSRQLTKQATRLV